MHGILRFLALCVAIALAALIGWLADIPLWRSFIPGAVSMNPLTALLFIASSLAAWLQYPCRHAVRAPKSMLLLPSAVCLVGLYHLANAVWGWDAGLDRVLFSTQLFEKELNVANRMAPNTGLGFFFVGLALLMAWPGPRLAAASQTLAGTVAVLSSMALLGYLYKEPTFYGIETYIPMAPSTALCFLALSATVLWFHPDHGFVGIITSPRVGGHVARRILPAVVLAVPIFGYLRVFGERSGWYDTAMGVVLSVIFAVLLLTFVVLRTAALLNQNDAHRTQVEEERIKLNRQLELQAVQLRAAHTELESFSYSVSHDLRAPLRHIDGFVQLLQSKAPNLDPPARRYLNIIADSARQMGCLIDDLLAFSRMGRQEMQQQEVNLEELAKSVSVQLASETPDRNLEWKIASLPTVAADPAMLRQVLVNLFSNAVKYTRRREKAVIEVFSTPATNGHLTIGVRDNGVGFEMEYADKLFGVFQRLHRADEFEGTGIGLANVRRVIHRHGGQTWAEGQPGKGATFFFSLPNERILWLNSNAS